MGEADQKNNGREFIGDYAESPSKQRLYVSEESLKRYLEGEIFILFETKITDYQCKPPVLSAS